MRLTAPLFLLSSVAFAFASAPSAHAGGPAVCNAKHKRPANLYGSVLSDGLKPVLAAAPAANAPAKVQEADKAVAPAKTAEDAASTKAVQVSRAKLRASFASCEGDRA